MRRNFNCSHASSARCAAASTRAQQLGTRAREGIYGEASAKCRFRTCGGRRFQYSRRRHSKFVSSRHWLGADGRFRTRVIPARCIQMAFEYPQSTVMAQPLVVDISRTPVYRHASISDPRLIINGRLTPTLLHAVLTTSRRHRSYDLVHIVSVRTVYRAHECIRCRSPRGRSHVAPYR